MKLRCRLIKANTYWLKRMNKQRRLVNNCSRVFLHCPYGVNAKWLKRVMSKGQLFIEVEQ